jgi:hypothetical protein
MQNVVYTAARQPWNWCWILIHMPKIKISIADKNQFQIVMFNWVEYVCCCWSNQFWKFSKHIRTRSILVYVFANSECLLQNGLLSGSQQIDEFRMLFENECTNMKANIKIWRFRNENWQMVVSKMGWLNLQCELVQFEVRQVFIGEEFVSVLASNQLQVLRNSPLQWLLSQIKLISFFCLFIIHTVKAFSA